MYGEPLLESLIQGIYKAAVNGAAWLTFLSSFGGALDSTHPSFFLADTSSREGSIEVSVGLDDNQRRAYRDYYVHRNVWIQGARPLLRPGSIRSSDQVCSRREFERSEWYADFCRPLGWTRGIGATILLDGTMTANIGAFRGVAGGEYTEEEFALIRELMPHLQRGLKMHLNLAASRAHGEALEAVLHGLSTPALLVAQDGAILYMNTAAERLLLASNGLLAAGGRLGALLPDDNASLSALVGGAAQTSTGQARKAGGTLLISRPYGRGPLEVLVSPLPALQDHWLLRQRAVAAIFVTERFGDGVADDSALARRYGLTGCEARVTVAISQGLSGKQICRDLNISYNTLKTHVRHIYAKTGAKRQSDLVHLSVSGTRVGGPCKRGVDA